MQCRHCGEANPEHAKFCIECGTPFAPRCSSCGAENPARAKFCAACGVPLTQVDKGIATIVSSRLSVLSLQSPTPNPQPPIGYTPSHLADRIRAATVTDGERKTITALFADLKGSTALIEGLDPEEARTIIDPALQLMMEAVHRYEGYVAQALGDGIFALFGAPLAHEDHPQRALYAALRMQEEMRRYGDEIRLKHGVPLAMRVGINTGEVVVRSIRKDDLHADYVPVGHSTNLAARMEQMATPGSILVTAYTHKLTEGYFAFKALGQTQIKGVEEPLHVYEVLGAGPLRTRLQVSARRGLTQFVGRQTELEQMQNALEHAKAGRGQIVGVMGEPGLGKSRLFYEFQLLAQSGCLILEASSVSHGKASPYLPVIELLKSYFDIQAQDDERKRREKIAGKVVILDRTLEDTLPYLYALLGIEEQPSPLQQMDPQIRRKRTFEALKKLFLRESLTQPLILIFEDLHWIDSETQGFLDTLSESIASAKILLLVNYRPEYRHEWGQKTYYTQLRLTPFGKAEAEEFLDELLGASVEAQQATPLQALKHLILERTEGTPFFMEEIVQELRERDLLSDPRTVDTPHLQMLPTTVQGVLASRIDRLAPEEKTLLQQLAVVGREFPLSLVKQVIVQPEEHLYRLLSLLQHKEFLYEQPAFPEVEYLFKHALTQEVAYNSVLIEQRKALHEQTAHAIESIYLDRLEEHYSELAHHYSRSNNTEKAIDYLHKAGQQAVQRLAHTEAVEQLRRAVQLLSTLPDTIQHQQQELTMHMALGPLLMTLTGWATDEVEQTYVRAQALCRQVGDKAQLFPILRGLCTLYVIRGKLHAADEIAHQLLTLASDGGDAMPAVEAHIAQGASWYWQGKFSQAHLHFQQAANLYRQGPHGVPTLHYGRDAGVVSLSYLNRLMWILGYPEQSLQWRQEAITLAHTLQHPFSLTWALGDSVVCFCFRRDWQTALEQAEAALIHATEHGFTPWITLITAYRGRALVEHSRSEEGIAALVASHTSLRETRSEVSYPLFAGMLAEAYAKCGDIDDGIRVVTHALEVAKESGGQWFDAELYRIRGTLTLQKLSVPSPNPPASNTQAERELEAEGYFLKAIGIAQQQQAKFFELRATVYLARLWQQQDKRAEAHQMLSTIYNWFTEGFDTKDLQEAKALLEVLQ